MASGNRSTSNPNKHRLNYEARPILWNRSTSLAHLHLFLSVLKNKPRRATGYLISTFGKGCSMERYKSLIPIVLMALILVGLYYNFSQLPKETYTPTREL